MKTTFFPTLLFLIFCAITEAAERPNIVLIMADDLGYGDVGAMNPDSKIKTPYIDSLASEGMRFRDMHSPSSVCTPTRYGILTGRYCWRSRLKSGIVWGYSRALIEPERPTIASILKKAGYHTAVIGKWHLGLDWEEKENVQTGDVPAAKKTALREDAVDFTKPFKGGPNVLGFDYFFGLSCSLNTPPYVYLENDRALGVPTISKNWGHPGLAVTDFEPVDFMATITGKAVKYIESRVETEIPFFLYFALNSPHTPIVPNADWQKKSNLNPYADFVMQTDAAVGTILETIDRLGIREKTLVIVTSDNGCAPQANFPFLQSRGHDPSGGFRGMKADIFEGGHRIPFLIRWSGKIKPGSVSDQLGCLVDLMATFAEITGQPLPEQSAEDSVSLLPALFETATSPIHTEVIHHSVRGDFAIRQGDWKLCLCPGSGGLSEPRPGSTGEEGFPQVQLYNLKSDPKETTNLEKEYPEKVRELSVRLKEEIIPATKPLSR